MKATFLEGALVAALTSLVGSMLYHVLQPLYGGDAVLRGLSPLLGLGYVAYLLVRCRVRIGHMTILVAWTVAALAIAVLSSSVLCTLAAHLGLVWLVRSFIYHARVLPALADLVLSGLSLIAAAWAVAQTQSLCAALWCLMLVQAMFPWIPTSAPAKPTRAPSSAPARFVRAQRAAVAALSALSSRSR